MRALRFDKERSGDDGANCCDLRAFECASWASHVRLRSASVAKRGALAGFAPVLALLVGLVVASGVAACGRGSAEAVTPSELSTGPVLQWIELDLGFDFAMSLHSTSDGRVVAIGDTSDGTFAARVTDNGADWATLPLPDGIAPLALDASGDRWVMIGAPPGVHDSDEMFGQVFFTDNDGSSWTDATLGWPPDEPLPEYATRSTRAVEALTSGDHMVVAVLTYSGFDLESLLADQSRIPDGEFMAYWEPDEESLTVWFRDLEPGDGAADENEVTLTYAELGLTPAQMEIVRNVESDALIHLFAGDDATLGPVASFGGSDAVGRWTDEGFVLLPDDWSHVSPQPRVPKGPASEGVILIVTRGDPSRLTSPDGLAWQAQPLTQYAEDSRRESSVVDATGTVWSTWRASDGRWVSIRAGGDSGSPQERARFEGIRLIDLFAVGEAGLAAVAWPDIPERWSFARSGRIAKEGYELRYGEPDGGLTLWSLTTDEAVYEFPARNIEAPEGVRQVGFGRSYSLIFEDLETNNELVTFTAADLEAVFGRCWWTSGRPNVFSTQASWAAGPFPEFREWVGWSTDGSEWGWQSIADAFDLCEARTDISLAVGRDFVIALAHNFDPPPSIPNNSDDEHQAQTSGVHQWFIARVP